MRVGVGFSDNPDTVSGGVEAARLAVRQGEQGRPGDFALLFATARHDAVALRDAVALVLGDSVPIVGGGASGIITNRQFGYAGDQIGIAVFWMDRAKWSLTTTDGLLPGTEEAVGERLGEGLAAAGVVLSTPVFLFYDAVDRTSGDFRLMLATPLLEGIEKKLGCLTNLVGAGFQGDYIWSATSQWLGDTTGDHHALALSFGEGVGIATAVMHGCRPASGYHMVTRAEGQAILEIDGRPSLEFFREFLGSDFPLGALGRFLILGINKGDKWGAFNERSYINHLCLSVDCERNALIMFEPDMVAGTEFQIMHRSLHLNYIVPKIDGLFSNLHDRKPVFGLYIDCAGRAAGYGGVDLEDALVVQRAVADRVPLLGIYSGVEIAPVGGRPRALDWTGVFCLASVPE